MLRINGNTANRPLHGAVYPFFKSHVALSILGVKGHGLVRTNNTTAAMSFCDITKSHTIIINGTSLMLAILRRL